MDDKYNYDEYQYGKSEFAEKDFMDAESVKTESVKTESVKTESISEESAEMKSAGIAAEPVNAESSDWEFEKKNSVSSESQEENYGQKINFVLQEPKKQEQKKEYIYTSYSYDNANAAGEYAYDGKSSQSEQETANKAAENSNFARRSRKKTNKTTNKTMKKWITCICMAAVFGLVASAIFQVSNRVIDGIFGETVSKKDKEVNTTQITTEADVNVLSDVSKVAENVMPSVVSITCLTVQEVQSYFFGGGYTKQYESSGSGIIIGQNEEELLIVTNNHVVEDSSTVTVTFMNDTNVEASIKGTDPDIDVAIIAVSLNSIETDTLNVIKVANLGDSDQLKVGEPTIAIGNALGYGQSVTNGIVSALGRTMEGLETGLIQTNAAINPGNSGGALLNAAGEVIGINTAKIGGENVEGLGFAIPISDIKEVLNDLMNKVTRQKVEEAKRGTLGIQVVSVDETASQMYGMPEGAQVREVIQGGAAEKAGIPKGAIITKFDGTRIKSKEDVIGILEYYEKGETVEVVVQVYSQNGEYVEKIYDVTLGGQSDLE